MESLSLEIPDSKSFSSKPALISDVVRKVEMPKWWSSANRRTPTASQPARKAKGPKLFD